MNEFEDPIQPVNDVEEVELRDEVRSLRLMFSLSLLLSFVFSFMVFVYFLRLNSAVNAQITQQQIMVTQAAEAFNRVHEYANAHPDFAPIFQKYSHVLNIRTNGTSAPGRK